MVAARRPGLRAAWLACGFAFVGLVVYLSLTTSPIDAGRVEGVKVGHFIAYAWLTTWFAEIYETQRARIAWGFGFMLLGVALEYAQGMTGYRTFAYSDMVDNAYGVVAGLCVALTPVGSLFGKLSGD